jgi:hypothetical protein
LFVVGGLDVARLLVICRHLQSLLRRREAGVCGGLEQGGRGDRMSVLKVFFDV